MAVPVPLALTCRAAASFNNAVLSYGIHFLRDIAGFDASTLKAGSYAALMLEERFIRDGWPVGEFVASIDQLQSQLHLGRGTCREALSILQARGFIRTRRGRNGGVVISRPDFDELVSSFALHLMLANATADDVLQAVRIMRLLALRRAMEVGLSREQVQTLCNTGGSPVTCLLALICNPALELFLRLAEAVAAVTLQHTGTVAHAWKEPQFEPVLMERFIQAIAARDVKTATELLDGTQSQPVQRYARITAPVIHTRDCNVEAKLAGQVAVRLALEMSSAELHEGGRFGSETVIGERLEVGVPVVRQAIRILEDMGVVYTQRGGGGGLMRRKPLQSSIIRQVFAYLTGLELSLERSLECAEQLAREASALAAQRGEVLTPPVRKHWLAGLTAGVGLDARCFAALENQIHESLGNPVITICMRAVASYNSWRLADRIPNVMPEYLAATRDELESIASLDSTGAYQAQSWKDQLLRKQMEN